MQSTRGLRTLISPPGSTSKDANCVTECKCWEGWNGEACEMDDEKMEQRKNLRDNLANGLVQLAGGQEVSEEALQGSMTTVSSLISSHSEVSAAAVSVVTVLDLVAQRSQPPLASSRISLANIGKVIQGSGGSDAFTLTGSMVSLDADSIAGLAACIPLPIPETEEDFLVEPTVDASQKPISSTVSLKIGNETQLLLSKLVEADNATEMVCNFWNEEANAWLGDGCYKAAMVGAFEKENRFLVQLAVAPCFSERYSFVR